MEQFAHPLNSSHKLHRSGCPSSSVTTNRKPETVNRQRSMNLTLALLSMFFLFLATERGLAEDTAQIPINHIIYIIQENITFDHYFGTYPGADGIPANLKLSFRPGGQPRFGPFHLKQTAIPRDLNHSWQAAQVAYDGGKMDGFLWAEWPEALEYYWQGEVPQIDPEKIKPIPGLPGNGAPMFFPNVRNGQFTGKRPNSPPTAIRPIGS